MNRNIRSGVFGAATPTQMNSALLLLRFITGFAMAVHGWQKVFSLGMGAVAANFAKMGIPLAQAAGPFVSLLELVGGIALIAGLFTRPVALLLAIDMLVAALFVHRPNGFTGQGGMELTLLLGTGAAALTLAGAGRLSVDALLDRSGGE